MSQPLLSVDVDARPTLAALDRLAEDLAAARTKAASKVTADAIATEAKRRVRRRTGLTAEGIVVEEDRARVGYVVLATRQQFPNLPHWLEHGTKFMTASPFFFPSARLEEAAHERRIREALQLAIDDVGLGD